LFSSYCTHTNLPIAIISSVLFKVNPNSVVSTVKVEVPLEQIAVVPEIVPAEGAAVTVTVAVVVAAADPFPNNPLSPCRLYFTLKLYKVL
jgi:hypothetical protein